MKLPKQVVLVGVIATATPGRGFACYQDVRFANPMLPAVAIILFFIGAVLAALTMVVAYAVDEYSKHDLKGYIASLWLLIGIGGAICGFLTFAIAKSRMSWT